MNEREKLLSVFRGESVSPAAWFGDLSWWYAANGRKNGYEGDEGYLRMHMDTRTGIYLYAPVVYKESYSEDIRFSSEKRGNLTISRISTSLGDIESVSRYLPESFTSAYLTCYIKKTSDLEIMKHIWKNRFFSPSYEEFERIDRLWNGFGLPVALTPGCTTPLQTLITRWAGVEKTIDLLMEAPEEVEETMKVMEDSDDELFRIIGESPAVFVEFPDNLSGDITGRRFIEKYEVPYWEKRIGQLHEKRKYVGIHNDGSVRCTIPILAEAGFDFIEAVTPSPVGDVPLEEIMSMSGDKSIIWGGLPGSLFSPAYSEEFFSGYIRDIMKVCAGRKNFVLGVADQVPPDAEISRISLVRKIIEDAL